MTKLIWKFFTGLPAFVAGITIFKNGLVVTYESIKNNTLLLTLFIISTILALIWLAKNLRRVFRDFLDKKNSLDIKNEIKKLTTAKTQSFNEMIPNQELIQKLGEESIRKGKEWSEDARLNNINFYIYINSGTVSRISSQAIFISKWKNAVLTVYGGNSESKTLIELSSSRFVLNRKKRNFLFYEKISNWRAAVIKSYEAIKESLGDNFMVSIHPNKNSFFIHYNFKTSELEKCISFEFNGRKLVNKSANTSIVII